MELHRKPSCPLVSIDDPIGLIRNPSDFSEMGSGTKV